MENSIAFGIVLKLMKGKRLTATEIAQEYEISPRTVYRYVDTLCASGVPLITFNGKNGGIEIDNNYVLNQNFLTKDETEYLLNLLKNDKKSIKNCNLIEKIGKIYQKD